MTHYIATEKQVPAEIPEGMESMGYMEIVGHCQDNWAVVDDGMDGRSVPDNDETAMMMAVSDTIFDPKWWENAIAAKAITDRNGADAMEWVKAAVVWYHWAVPTVIINGGQEGVYSSWYAC